jgi:CheY-like chemotaxis protein
MQDKSKILIVDDEPDIVSYLELVLQELGYVTVSARNGAEALERVTADPPDLVLLDLVMPVMDGFTVCRKLKEGEATRLIPVIIMTALDGIDDRVKAIIGSWSRGSKRR